MYDVSESFDAAMKTRPYIARLILDDVDVIQGEAIQDIVFRGGTNGESDAFTLGGTVAGSVEITLDKAQVPSVHHGRQIKAELGMDLPTGTQWVPMGVYYVTEPLADDDRLTITACDALATKFEREYETLPGLDFSADDGVSSTVFLTAICERRGVEVDTSNLESILLHTSPDGFTERQIIGFIAALYGGFASVDRSGVLRIRTFSKTAAKVTADDYYESGMEKAEYSFSVQWLKCYNEITELTMVMGDLSAQQGIYLESIWMNYTILANLWEKLQGFSYVPVTELSFFGNPLIDAGDIITMEDMSGVSVEVPVMRVTHEYDGGVITRISANGQAETESYASSVNRQIQRINVKVKTSSNKAYSDAKKYTDDLDTALDQVEVLKRLTANNTDDAIYLVDGRLVIDATAIRTGVLSADVIDGTKLNITGGSRIANFHISGGYLYNGIDIGNANSCGIGCGSALGGSDDWIFWAGNGAFRVTLGGKLHTTNLIASGGWISGWTIDDNSIRTGTLGQDGSMWLCSTGTETSANIGTGSGNGWCIGVGANFGVKKDGSLFASNANISGTINASHGKIGGWKINGNSLTSAEADDNGEVYNAVYMMTNQLYYMYNQSAGAGIFTSWENVVLAGKAAGQGVSGTFTFGEKTCTFLNGIVTSIS